MSKKFKVLVLFAFLVNVTLLLTGCVKEGTYMTPTQVDDAIQAYEPVSNTDLEDLIDEIYSDLEENEDYYNAQLEDFKAILYENRDTLGLVIGLINEHTAAFDKITSDIEYAYWYMEDNYSLILEQEEVLYVLLDMMTMTLEFNDARLEYIGDTYRDSDEYYDFLGEWEDYFIENYPDYFYDGFLTESSTNWLNE